MLVFALLLFGCKSKPKKSLQLSQKEETHSIFSPDPGNPSDAKSTWYKLIDAGKLNDYQKFSNFSMDTINACNKSMTLLQFMETCSSELLSESFFNRIKDPSKIEVQTNEVISSYYSPNFLSGLKDFGKTFIIYRVQVDLKDSEPNIIAFDFVLTGNGYKFFSCDVYGGPECCR